MLTIGDLVGELLIGVDVGLLVVTVVLIPVDVAMSTDIFRNAKYAVFREDLT